MGWERRGGRTYLYHARRVGQSVVRTYLGRADAEGEATARTLVTIRRQQANVRMLAREARVALVGRIKDLVIATAEATATVRTIADGLLYAAGYYRHRRSEWRMKGELRHMLREVKALKERVERLRDEPTGPAMKFNAPTTDTEAVALFERCRAGDRDAQHEVRRLIVRRQWAEWLGNLGEQATTCLIRQAAGGDVAWEQGIAEKASGIERDLANEHPSPLERLLIRRVVNNWITCHALEIKQATRPPTDLKVREFLDRSLSRSQKRLADALRELARVRRLLPRGLSPQFTREKNEEFVRSIMASIPSVGGGEP